MTASELLALLGAAATIITIVGAIVASHRWTTDKIQKGDDALHERVNRVRDEYVCRVDLDTHMARIETNVRELREESREGTREINRRLDTMLTALRPTERRRADQN